MEIQEEQRFDRHSSFKSGQRADEDGERKCLSIVPTERLTTRDLIKVLKATPPPLLLPPFIQRPPPPFTPPLSLEGSGREKGDGKGRRGPIETLARDF